MPLLFRLCECGCGKSAIEGNVWAWGHWSTRSETRRKLSDKLSKMRKPTHEDDVRRFWSKVNIKDEKDCWDWTASLNGDGYGYFSYDKRMCKAHRISWMFSNGIIEDGVCILHSCDNPKCVNPNHLFKGSQFDNVVDMYRKGRKDIEKIRKKGTANPAAKLLDDDVELIRNLYSLGVWTQVELGRLFDVHPSSIRDIICRRTWRHL